jgi:hypothetical protein
MQRHFSVMAAIGLGLLFPFLMALVGLAGCQAGTLGPFRPIAPKVYHDVTNTVATVATTSAQVLPPPFATAIETAAAAVLALLAAWQGITHRKLTRLENGAPQSPTKGSP